MQTKGPYYRVQGLGFRSLHRPTVFVSWPGRQPQTRTLRCYHARLVSFPHQVSFLAEKRPIILLIGIQVTETHCYSILGIHESSILGMTETGHRAVYESEFSAQGLGFRLYVRVQVVCQGSEFRMWGVGSKVYDVGIRVQGRGQDLGFRVYIIPEAHYYYQRHIYIYRVPGQFRVQGRGQGLGFRV